ncbi:DNA replication licensing factor mcm6 [Phytophthora cinnamomi]|uniref:DNA replication licensing factor mcm6 n=1 Tax=Phytophthora cinnamomi TaxID=4785 RepID=UPI0035595C3A|nr:DNA replication licensing factor mcm6 [Phytophthora cinnamomi]
MDARDAIVSWLEQGDNFLRVTAAAPFSPRRDSALEQLAAFVNRSLPRANWNVRHAKQMLKHYLLEFRCTAEAAQRAQLSLDERDALRGLKTVQDKLEHMCRHFHRLQRLHELVTPRSRQQDKQQPTYVKLPFAVTEAQRREREQEVVPESDLSNSCENSEADRSAAACSNEATVVQLTVSGGEEGEKVEPETLCAQGSTEVVASRSTGKERGASVKVVTAKQQEKKEVAVPKKQGVVPTPRVVMLASDEEEVDEELPTVRRSTRTKRQYARKAALDGAASTRKRARREPTAKKAEAARGEMADVTPTQTTQDANSASDEPQNSPANDENTPSLNTQNCDNPQQWRAVRKVAATSEPLQASGPLLGAKVDIHTDSPPQHKEKLPQQPSSPTPSSHDRTRKSTPGSAVPEAYRSAIAEVISQRKQLMSRMGDAGTSQALPTQEKRQRSLSESDYGLSDIDLPAADQKPSTPRNSSRSSKSTGAPRSRQVESGPTAGLLPPLIDAFRTASGKSNVERKRVFHRAKELAFEQLKWHRENALQQSELDLLRREMEARESFALQELQLKRMRIRADIIQHMVSAGASITAISERLSLL